MSPSQNAVHLRRLSWLSPLTMVCLLPMILVVLAAKALGQWSVLHSIPDTQTAP